MPPSLAPLIQAVELIGVGLLAGVIGGMLGVGGGLVMIPAMVIFFGERFGPDSIHLYKLASIAASVVVSLPAVARHSRAGTIVSSMLPPILPAAFIGIFVGVVLAALPIFRGGNTQWLERLFGVYLLSVVIVDIVQKRLAAGNESGAVSQCPTPRRWMTYALGVGFPTGVIAGMLGIGGGTYSIPVQNMLMGMRLRYAIATSQVIVLFVALLTSIVQGVAVYQLGLPVLTGLMLSVGIAPGAIAGSWLGAGLTYRVPIGGLRTAFQILLIASAIKLLV